MTLLDAARQAMKALETNNEAWKHLADSGDDGFWEAEEQPFYEMSAQAITALRQAIEQAEFDAVHDALEKESGIHITQQAEQQEPVAWIEHIAGGVEYNPYHKAALKLPEGMRFDLYTTPPQRKPLTAEEIFEVHKRVDSMQYLTFARAIESKHGIGGGE